MSALLLLANAYVDIGTWHGITPYVGAGIGGAHVKWDTSHNTDRRRHHRATRRHRDWRFAYALMAGASYCLTDQSCSMPAIASAISRAARMFEFDADSAGPGYDRRHQHP